MVVMTADTLLRQSASAGILKRCFVPMTDGVHRVVNQGFGDSYYPFGWLPRRFECNFCYPKIRSWSACLRTFEKKSRAVARLLEMIRNKEEAEEAEGVEVTIGLMQNIEDRIREAAEARI